MHIMAEEKAVPRDVRKNASTHHPRSQDLDGNIRPASHPSAQISHKRAPPDPHYVPYSAQGNFTPTPRFKPEHQTAEHDSDVPEGSVDLSSGDQGTGHQRSRDHDERPGLDEESVLPKSRYIDTTSSSRYQGDQVFL